MVQAKFNSQVLLQRIQRGCQYIRQRDALLGLFIQSLALMATLLIAKLFASLTHFALPTASLFILQSIFSVSIASALTNKAWWLGIHAVFPIGIGVMMLLSIPSDIYLVLFVVSSGVFWTTFQSQVPFYPSKQSLYPLLDQILPKNRPIRMMEIGSGLGGVSLALAKRNPISQFEGIEIAPIPWLISLLRAYTFKPNDSNVKFILGSYYDIDFANYDVIYAYLSPAATADLWKKARQEMQMGSLLISHEFPIEGIAPSQIIENTLNKEQTYIYSMHL